MALVLTTSRDRVRTIRFSRPEKLNAWNAQLRCEFSDALESFENDTDDRVLILCGDRKAFGVGADVSGAASPDRDVSATALLERVRSIERPVIASIDGYCLGGALELALCCDIRMAASTAVFGLPELNLGVIPGLHGTSTLAKRIGADRTAYLLLTGARISSEAALNFGLVTVLADDDLEQETIRLAETIAAKPPLAARYAKAIIKDGVFDNPMARLAERLAREILLETEDRKEGLAAFREKRSPTFSGK